MTDHSELIQNTVNEFRRFAKRSLVPLVEQLEHAPATDLYRRSFMEALGFGWIESEEMVGGDRSAADAMLSELFFALGEETLAGSLGIGLIAHLLPNRLLGSVGQRDVHYTYPLFAEPLRETSRTHRPDAFPLVPLVGCAKELCWPAGTEQLVRLPLDEGAVGLAGPVRTLGLRGCPLYDIQLVSVQPPPTLSLPLQGGGDIFSSPLTGEDSGGGERLLQLNLGNGRNEGEATAIQPIDMKAALDSARKWTLALAAGIFSGGLTRAVAYASERYQGGDLIIRHSGLRTIISRLQATLASAEMTFRNDLLAPNATNIEERGPFLPLFAESMESLAERSQHIIQIFGGYGYMEDFTVERVYRDVTTLAVAFGRRGFDRVQA